MGAEIPIRPDPRAGTMATVRRGVVPRLPAFRMAPNSPLFRIRRSRPNRAFPGDTNEVSVAWRVPLVRRLLGAEALPSFGAASLDHKSSAARSHAHEEAVSPFSAAIVRLERSLHCFWDPLRKVEPAMLSGIHSVVKSSLFWGVARGGSRVIVPVSRGAALCPIPSLFSWLSG